MNHWAGCGDGRRRSRRSWGSHALCADSRNASARNCRNCSRSLSRCDAARCNCVCDWAGGLGCHHNFGSID